MTKTVDTLVEDIYDKLQEVINGDEIEIPDEAMAQFAKNIVESLKRQLTPRAGPRKEKVVYFSEAGKPCKRAVWYAINGYEQEPIAPHTLIKFIYGDMLEELLALLARLGGHEVTDEQKSTVIELPNGWQLRGRMDYKIDGVIVDAKSASTYAFNKFKKGTLTHDDPFGYMTQLASYGQAEGEFDKLGFLAIDKQNGHITLYQPDTMDLLDAIPDWDEFIHMVEDPHRPDRGYDDEPHQSSGNRKLCMSCSYCGFKETCWADANGGAGLRTFLYKNHNGAMPVMLTEVKKLPKVKEIT